jgi:outer membrane protein OmpU
MKKVLLATTILGMTSGFAAAEIAFTGTATAGFAKTGADTTATESDFETYTSFELSVAASGESDSGLAFGASTSFKSGKSYVFDGIDSEFETNGVGNDNEGTMGNPEVFVSGDFGKVSFKVDGFADYANDDDNTDDDGDVKYTHSIAGFDIGVISDIDTEVNDLSLSLAYEVSGVKLAAVYDNDAEYDGTESYNISAETAFGPITAGIDYDVDMDADAVTTLALTYAADAITIGVELSDNDTWSASAGYSANGLSLEASTDDAEEWVVTGSYDLGGGLTAEAGTDSFESVYVGAKMAF